VFYLRAILLQPKSDFYVIKLQLIFHNLVKSDLNSKSFIYLFRGRNSTPRRRCLYICTLCSIQHSKNQSGTACTQGIL